MTHPDLMGPPDEDPLNGEHLGAPGSEGEEPDVFCPFSSDGRCPSNPPCATPRTRACIGDEHP